MTDNSNSEIGQAYIKRIRDRLLHKNKNWLAIICGETGSGKSYSAISLSHSITDSEVYIVFTPLEFLELIGSEELRKGDVIIFDEAGVGMSSREWYSIQNKLLGSVLQTFRNLNIGVIFTTPNLSFIDVQARKLFHSYIETDYIIRSQSLAILKPYEIKVNVRYNKIYYNYPRFIIDGQAVSVSRISVCKPTREQIDNYETRKTEYTRELNRRAYDTIKDALESKEEEAPKEINTEIFEG